MFRIYKYDIQRTFPKGRENRNSFVVVVVVFFFQKASDSQISTCNSCPYFNCVLKIVMCFARVCDILCIVYVIASIHNHLSIKKCPMIIKHCVFPSAGLYLRMCIHVYIQRCGEYFY